MAKDTAVVEVEHLKMLASEEVPWGRTSSSCSCAMSSLICTLSICLLSFAGFLWSDEIANLKESDISIFEEHLEVYIESSKTDQYRDGAWVVITHAHSNMCPVHMLESELHVPVRWSGLNGRCIFCRLSAAN